jgi:hypothetical protein
VETDGPVAFSPNCEPAKANSPQPLYPIGGYSYAFTPSPTPGTSGQGAGGAVYNPGSTLTLEDVTFDADTASTSNPELFGPVVFNEE